MSEGDVGEWPPIICIVIDEDGLARMTRGPSGQPVMAGAQEEDPQPWEIEARRQGRAF